jgi:aminoglycoside phosphotransferase (APT) family kinase protein
MSVPNVPRSELEAYLSAELDEEVTDTWLLDGALNTMVAVATETADPAYVVRKPTGMRDSELFVDLECEYAVLERLADTAVPAPKPALYCDDESVLGDEFIVTEFLDGETVPVGSRLPERFRTPTAREQVGERLVDALADLHSVDADRFAVVCERVTPRQQVERAVDRLEQATDTSGRDVPELRRVADWLRDNAPADSDTATALVHGDYKTGNVFLAETEEPDVVGVFDWETAMLGDPRTELGYFLFYWRDAGDPTPDVDALADRYDSEDAIFDLRQTNDHGFYRFSSRSGSPTRRELVARWEERTGLDFDHQRFHRALAAFGLATVWEDIHSRQVDADGESDWPPLLDYTASMTASIVDGEFPL